MTVPLLLPPVPLIVTLPLTVELPLKLTAPFRLIEPVWPFTVPPLLLIVIELVRPMTEVAEPTDFCKVPELSNVGTAPPVYWTEASV